MRKEKRYNQCSDSACTMTLHALQTYRLLLFSHNKIWTTDTTVENNK